MEMDHCAHRKRALSRIRKVRQILQGTSDDDGELEILGQFQFFFQQQKAQEMEGTRRECIQGIHRTIKSSRSCECKGKVGGNPQGNP